MILKNKNELLFKSCNRKTLDETEAFLSFFCIEILGSLFLKPKLPYFFI